MANIIVFSTQYCQNGGIESHLRDFCENLTSRGIQIDLVILNSTMLISDEIFFKKICRNVFLGTNFTMYSRMLWLAKVCTKINKFKYNALYTNGQGNSVYIFSKLIRYFKYWIHHHHTSGDKYDRLTWSKLYVDALKKANEVIACSNRNAYEMSCYLNRPIKSIPCFSKSVTDLKERLPNSKFHLGYYGRLIPEKGVDLLCKLSEDSELFEHEFHIWGQGIAYPPAFFLKFPKLVYHGTFIRTEGLHSVLQEIDAYLLLSSHPEGLPISLLEVMSAGIPWIATNQGGISDIACDLKATKIISSSATYDDVKLAILELISDMRSGLVNRKFQRDNYMKKFSAPVISDQWIEVLKLTQN